MSLANVLRNVALDVLIKYQGLTYAEVVSYDQDAYTIDAQILKFSKVRQNDTVENVNYPKVYDVPCLLQGGSKAAIKTDYFKNDIVILAHSVSEIDVDGIRSSDKQSILNKANCVCIGAVGSAGNSPAIQISDTEIVFTVGATTFTVNASGATVSVGGVSVNLLTHTHPYVDTPIGASITSPPTPGS